MSKYLALAPWQWEPWAVVLVILAALGYGCLLYQAWQVRPPTAHWHWYSPVLFLLGLGLGYLTFASPLNTLGTRYLFSVRMYQHILLIYGISFFLLAGIPQWLWHYLYERWGLCRWLLHVGTHAIAVAVIFNGLFTVWHIPFLFEAALHNPWVQSIERWSLGFVSVLMWMPLLCPLGLSRLQPQGQMLYLIALIAGQIPILGCLVLSRSVFYPTYGMAPVITSWDPLTDQIVGGLVLKFVSVVIFGLMIMKALLNWAHLEEQREILEETYQNSSIPPSAVNGSRPCV